MPYASNSELPSAVKDALPEKAQSIFRHVVNSELDMGRSDTVALQAAWSTLKRQGWEKGQDGKWKLMKGEFSAVGKITKLDKAENLVFGWASIIEDENGVVKDLQGDIIRPEELEKSAYAYVLDARIAGEMHKVMGVGNLVESMVFTKQKIEALGLSDGSLPIGWWVGFKVDSDIFAKVESGEYTAFSIGGSGKRKVIED